MDMSRILIAKTGKTASEWLPLAVHLEDTAGIMQCMIRDMIPPSFPESCALSPEAFEKTAVFLAYVHDIGKAMLVFQYKISRNLPEMRSRLEHFQLQFPESYEKDKINVIPHAQAGEEILVTLGCPESVAAVVGAHHGMPSEHIQKNLMQPRRNINSTRITMAMQRGMYLCLPKPGITFYKGRCKLPGSIRCRSFRY